MTVAIGSARVALSIALTVIDTQATLAAMWFFGWDPTKPQLYALAGIAAVLLTMMGFDVAKGIAAVRAGALTTAAAIAASTSTSPPLPPAVPTRPTTTEGGD